MPSLNRIVVATATRPLWFFDMTTMEPIYQLTGLSHMATSLAFHKPVDSDQYCLLWGDVSGHVNVMTFLQPNSGGLFGHPDGAASLNLSTHQSLTTYLCEQQLEFSPFVSFRRHWCHSDWVQSVSGYEGLGSWHC
jgi:hypothetical protein